MTTVTGKVTVGGAAYPVTAPVTLPAMPAPPGYGTKIFEDQFAGTTLDAAKWVTYIGSGGVRWAADGVPAPYSASTPHLYDAEMFASLLVAVDDGCTLTARPNTDQWSGDYPWISGIITTEGLFALPADGAWYVQVLAKMPDTSTGMWPAIWFMPGAPVTGNTQEFDGMEGGFTTGAGEGSKYNYFMHSDLFAAQGQSQEAYNVGAEPTPVCPTA